MKKKKENGSSMYIDFMIIFQNEIDDLLDFLSDRILIVLCMVYKLFLLKMYIRTYFQYLRIGK